MLVASLVISILVQVLADLLVGILTCWRSPSSSRCVLTEPRYDYTGAAPPLRSAAPLVDGD
ncbi:hypothetical protein [Mycobacterium leprae]|uniref:hypothetical protein n=1 Tax=Mycobacterium leprae TaxID=1769 RepID=UPI0002DA0BA5|nr:hypothetical protein [Mycobacterium leprae]